jgi:anti-anti-sigma factor
MSTNVRQKDGVIYISGAIVFETVALIQKQIDFIISSGHFSASICIDFSEVNKVNSAALGLLLHLKREEKRRNKHFSFSSLSQRLLSLAELYGLADFIHLG